MSVLETVILAVPVAMLLHMAIGFVLKYPVWLANGRTFRPEPATEAPEPVKVPETSPEPVPDVDLPSLPELLDQAAELTAKPLQESPETSDPGDEGEQPDFRAMGVRELRKWGSKRQIQGASRMKKAPLLEALLAS